MKKTFLLLFVFLANYSFAQFEILPNPLLYGSQLLRCPFDSSVSIYQVPNWQFYQTTNNQWNGPVDSSKCINTLIATFQETAVALSDIDTSRFLFCQLVLDSAHQLPLTRNSVLNAGIEFGGYPSHIQTGDCGGTPCSQLLVQVDIPDSTGTGRSSRTYNGTIADPNNSDPLFCFPTERFTDQYLKSYVVQVKAYGASSDAIDFNYFSVQGTQFGPYYLTDSMVAQSNNQLDLTSPPYVNYGYGGADALLALYSDTTYPGPSNYSYLRIFPTNPYDTTSQVITVTMSLDFDLMFQPYTEFAPAKVYNHPDTTHSLDLILDGATYCIPPEIEVIFNPGTNLIYRSGHIDFGGTGSCMQFRPNAKLMVADNTTFDYGDPAKPGILLLRENSTIQLNENSIFNMYGNMVLNELDRSAPGQFYMTLPPSTTLRFMSGSNIYAGYSINGAMRLNVYMKGGILDDSGLSDAAKQLINRIYDERDLNEDLVSIFPNPSNQSTGVKITAAADEQGFVEIFNMHGQLVYNTVLQLQKGINVTSISYGNLPGGEYLVRIKGSSVFYGKMMVIN